MDSAEFFASKGFLVLYSGMLISITAIAILANMAYARLDRRASRLIIAVLESAHTADHDGKINRLRQLNKLIDARILSNVACRDDYLKTNDVQKSPRATISRAAATYLGLLTSTTIDDHYVDGLRPARHVLGEEYKRLNGGLRGFADFIIRIALLGTFMGLIAALAIASNNIGAGSGPEAAQSEHMRIFIQELLATAANKFWISAIGIGCALGVQIYQYAVRNKGFITQLGDAFDKAIANPEIAAAWCPKTRYDEKTTPAGMSALNSEALKNAIAASLPGANMAPLNKAIEEIAGELRLSAKSWTLAVSPGSSVRREG